MIKSYYFIILLFLKNNNNLELNFFVCANLIKARDCLVGAHIKDNLIFETRMFVFNIFSTFLIELKKKKSLNGL